MIGIERHIDPESHTLRTYYPDFLAVKKDGEYVIVEVKRDDMIEDAVVQAKAEYAIPHCRWSPKPI